MNFKTLKLIRILPFFICFFMVNLFIIYFINKERFIYFQDFSGYFYMSQDLTDLFKNNPFNAINILMHSIRYDDYNLLSVFFLVPFNLLFGTERLTYILLITDIFALLSIFVLIILINRIFQKSSHEESFFNFFIPFVIILLFPQFWIPILQGRIDVIGILVISLILLYYIKIKDLLTTKQNLFDLIFIGLLLTLLVLLRRYYAYWVVSFLIAIPIEMLILNKFEIKNFWHLTKNIFTIGIVWVISFFIVATPIQYFARPTDQRVIIIIAEQILNQSNNISQSYKKLPYKFSLDNNVEVFIYEKVKPFNKSDLNALSQLFIDFYPDKKDIFTIKD